MIRKIPLIWCVAAFLAGCAATDESMAPHQTSHAEQPGAESAVTEGEAPPPPGTPAAETETAMAMPAEDYLVYFPPKSWLLDDAAETIIDDAVVTAQSHGLSRFVVTGHADGTGSRHQNMRASKLRAEAVADALIARGIAMNDIETIWRGAEEPAVAASTGTSVRENRRVTIELR